MSGIYDFTARSIDGREQGVLGSEAIKWNFTKFLVDKSGKVLERYASKDSTESIAKDLESVL